MLDRRRWFILAIVATLSLTGLAACGDDSDEPEAALSADNEEEATEAIEALGEVPDEADLIEPQELEEEKEAGIQQEAPTIPPQGGLEIDPAILQSQLGAWIQPQVGEFTLENVTVDEAEIETGGAVEALSLTYNLPEDGVDVPFSHWMELHATPEAAAAKRDARVQFYQTLPVQWTVVQSFDLHNEAGELLGSGVLMQSQALIVGLEAVIWSNGDRVMVAAGKRGAEFYNNSSY